MKKRGFTLAEVLITLTVIGIVAAISLPALMQSVNERTWEAKRKALLSRMGAAISQIDDFSGFGTKTGATNATMAESFIIDGLSKVYKIKGMCDSTSLDKCGIPKKFTTLQGTVVEIPKTLEELLPIGWSKNTNAAAFETENGEKIVLYYNPSCRAFYPSEVRRHAHSGVCINFIFDLNGLDEPNEIGKDMGFMSVVYDTGITPEVVAPNVYYAYQGDAPSYHETTNAPALCKKLGGNYSLPSANEELSILFNNKVTGIGSGLTGTLITPGSTGTVWAGGYDSKYPMIYSIARTTAANVYCVKD